MRIDTEFRQGIGFYIDVETHGESIDWGKTTTITLLLPFIKIELDIDR